MYGAWGDPMMVEELWFSIQIHTTWVYAVEDCAMVPHGPFFLVVRVVRTDDGDEVRAVALVRARALSVETPRRHRASGGPGRGRGRRRRCTGHHRCRAGSSRCRRATGPWCGWGRTVACRPTTRRTGLRRRRSHRRQPPSDIPVPPDR